MLRSLVKNPIKFLFAEQNRSNPVITHLNFLHNFSSISKPQQQEEDHQSLTVSYLINSCGLSPQSALSASKKFSIKTTEKPDAVLNVLRSYGFSGTQITKLIAKYPRLLLSYPDNTIRPKLEFFLGVGCSNTQLTELISSCPDFLKSSLEKRIIPNFESLRPVLETNKQLLVAVRRDSRMLSQSLETNFLRNVRLLQGYGVPGRSIARLATLKPRSVMQTTEQFKMSIESTMQMGFDPSSPMFVYGVSVMSAMRPSTWERKMAMFKSVGWSEEEVVSAFGKHPYCMTVSEEKVKRSMGFFVNDMHWGPSFVAVNPVLLKLSFEKRVVPRCLVMNVLVSKGFVREKPFASFLTVNEEKFMKLYLTKYQDQVPEVLEVTKATWNRQLGKAPNSVMCYASYFRQALQFFCG